MKKLFLILIVFVCGCYTISRDYLKPAGKDETLRLLTLSNIKSCNISTTSGFKVINAENGLQISTSSLPDTVSLEFDNNNLVMKGKALSADSIKILADNNIIKINNYTCRGNAEIYKDKDSLMVVNELSLEEYLYSVVGREMSASSPMEALKAQAVAARSFVLFHKNALKSKRYDTNNTGAMLSYVGLEKENPNAIKAVDSTRGEVLKYQGHIVFTPYYANCGGYTEDVKEVWGTNYPYLASVPCYFCRDQKHYSWSVEIPTAHIIESLKKNGYNITTVTNMEVVETSKTGRMKKLKISTDKGQFFIDTGQLRLLVGSDTLKSTKFKVRTKGESFLFTGKGWGHGVGLCQDGAEGMAKAGYKYKQILSRYYKNITVSDN